MSLELVEKIKNKQLGNVSAILTKQFPNRIDRLEYTVDITNENYKVEFTDEEMKLIIVDIEEKISKLEPKLIVEPEKFEEAEPVVEKKRGRPKGGK